MRRKMIARDIPVAAFAHNCYLPHYGLDQLTLHKALQAYYANVSFIDAPGGEVDGSG